MDSRVLIIHEYQILFEILNELSESLNFKIIKSNNNNLKKVKLNLKNNYVIISKKKFENEENILILDDMPIKFENFVEIINVNFLKKKFSDQSYIKIGKYSLDLNSRKITAKDKSVSLTERETNIIIFINDIIAINFSIYRWVFTKSLNRCLHKCSHEPQTDVMRCLECLFKISAQLNERRHVNFIECS